MCGMTWTGGAEIVTAALLGDDSLVDASGGEVAVATRRGAYETLVVAEIKIGPPCRRA